MFLFVTHVVARYENNYRKNISLLGLPLIIKHSQRENYNTLCGYIIIKILKIYK